MDQTTPATSAAFGKTAEAPAFDLDAIDPKALCNDGAWVKIRLDGEPIGLEIKVQGRFSDVYEKHQQAQQRRGIAEFKRSGKFPIDDPADQETKKLEVIVSCTIDWRGSATKGEAFSKDRIRQVYEKQKWIGEQIDRAINEDARFLKQ